MELGLTFLLMVMSIRALISLASLMGMDNISGETEVYMSVIFKQVISMGKENGKKQTVQIIIAMKVIIKETKSMVKAYSSG